MALKIEERLERMQRCLDELLELNHEIPILVEGQRDERALRALGATGPIHVLNTGKTLTETAHWIAQQHRRIIVLFDWDRTGGALTRRLQEQLHAQVELDLSFRRELAITSGVRSVEDLPSALNHVQERAARRAPKP